MFTYRREERVEKKIKEEAWGRGGALLSYFLVAMIQRLEGSDSKKA